MKLIITKILLLVNLSLLGQQITVNGGGGSTLHINNGGSSSITINYQADTYFNYDEGIFPFTHSIWRVGSVEGENYYHNFNADSFATTITGTTCHVDPVNGVNANDGTTWLLAKKAITSCISGSSANIIMLKENEWYNYAQGFQGTTITRDMKIVVENSGIAYATTAATDLTLTEDATYTNIWSGAYAPSGLSSTAIDLSNLDAEGRPIRLENVADSVAVDNTPNSIYTNMTTRKVYVRLFDDRAPDADFIYLLNKTQINGTSINPLYVEGVKFYGGVTGSEGIVFINNTTATTKTAVFKNCAFNYGITDGTAFNRYVQAYMLNCDASYNTNDGFNYRYSQCSGFEYYCRGDYNGFDLTNTANNGSTAHDAAKVMSVGGTYERNGGKNVHDIDVNTSRYMVGVTAGHSKSTSGPDQYAFAVGNGTGLTTWWTIECTATGATPGWKVFTSSQLYYKGGNYSTSTNLIQGTATELP